MIDSKGKLPIDNRISLSARERMGPRHVAAAGLLSPRASKWGLYGSVLLWLLFVVPVALASGPPRLALLVGNQGYQAKVGALENPHNDVALLSDVLKKLGFKVVVIRDAGLAEMHRVLNGYVRNLRAAGPGTIGFFYYSGHGAADGSTNYIIPVDVRSTDTTELWDQSLRLNEITRKLKREAGNATHFVVFDACRNTLKLSAPGTRSGLLQAKGYVPVAQEAGMLISYATAEGELASDEGDGAGLFARILSEEISKPGVEAVSMFRAVQIRVKQLIGQDPWLSFPSLEPVYFAGQSPSREADRSALLQVEAERVWINNKLDDTAERQRLEAYARQYEATAPYWGLKARQRIAMLNAEDAERRAVAAEAALKKEELRRRELARDLERRAVAVEIAQKQEELRKREQIKEEEIRRAAERAQRVAIDDKAWSEARQRHAFDGYRRYLAEFPDGSHRDEALDAVRLLEREDGLWAGLKDRREFRPLTSFRDSATSRDLYKEANRRLESLTVDEAKDWEVTTASQRLVDFRTFLLRWPDGPHSAEAKVWVERLERIAMRWRELRGSDSDDELEAFVVEHGWSEYGAEAAQRLVALRRERNVPSDSLLKVLTADELSRTVDGAKLRLGQESDTILFDSKKRTAARERVGRDFFRKQFRGQFAGEGAFEAEVMIDGRRQRLEGLAAIVKSDVDDTGSFFFLQMYGDEKSASDIDKRDRRFATLQMIQDRHGLVCVITSWEFIGLHKKPEKISVRCKLLR